MNIDYSTLYNWLISGLIGLFFGSVSTWISYRFQKKRDDIAWKRELEKVRQQFQHEKEIYMAQTLTHQQELAIDLQKKQAKKIHDDLTRGLDDVPNEINRLLEQTRALQRRLSNKKGDIKFGWSDTQSGVSEKLLRTDVFISRLGNIEKMLVELKDSLGERAK